MREWDARRVAAAAGAQLVHEEPRQAAAAGPSGASVDSRRLSGGELFVGLRGERVDGGAHAAQALAAGAWGALVAPEHADAAASSARAGSGTDRAGGAVLAHEDPLAGLHALARAWRRELATRGARVVAITGSTGKTSTKDILAALLRADMRVAASPANLNTEIGLPLALLAAPGDTQAVVLEMAMRGAGQIAQLTELADPDVGVIVNVGPAHLELLGSLEAVAAAKAELIAGMRADATAVVPAGERMLAAHIRAEMRTITFGEGGEVRLVEHGEDGWALVDHDGERIVLRPSFSQAYNLRNLLAAVAAARALGHTPSGRLDVEFSAMRGQRETLAGGVVLVDDCYNANPMSMRAAIDDLAQPAPGRRVAVLGDMLELGRESERMHREIGAYAGARGVELLLAVGPLAAAMAETFAGEARCAPDARVAAELVGGLLREGDTVLVKGSRGVGLERVTQMLRVGGERSAELRTGAGSAPDGGLAASASAPGRR
jgi:UDP-N-acetylmuramoyl-tripeptide--D-alanyl-D-alanine ligase